MLLIGRTRTNNNTCLFCVGTAEVEIDIATGGDEASLVPGIVTTVSLRGDDLDREIMAEVGEDLEIDTTGVGVDTALMRMDMDTSQDEEASLQSLIEWQQWRTLSPSYVLPLRLLLTQLKYKEKCKSNS